MAMDDNLQIGLFEVNMQTGLASIKNNDGDVLLSKLLSNNEKARFTSMDPHAENYYSWSPYAYCANNPLRITDPTGKDWYMDTDSSYQYDEKLNKENYAKRLKKGQSYVGATTKIYDNRGNLFANFRSDGSIMFASESGALARVVTNSKKTGNEEAVAILDKGALVMPNYKNDQTTAKWGAYGYNFKKGNIVNKNREESFSVITTAHTHPKGGDMTEDVNFATYSTPQKPVFAIHTGGATDGTIEYLISSGQGISQYTHTDVTRNAPSATASALVRGKMSLRSYAKIIVKSHMRNGVFGF